MSRKGLFIGINEYTRCNPLSGCVNDAIGMAEALKRNSNGSPNFSCRTITTSDGAIVTGAKITEMAQELFSGKADVAVFYFAGHGLFNDEIDEGLLVPQNYVSASDGVRISDILMYANKAVQIRNKVLILDCCQSGSAGSERLLKAGVATISEGVTVLTACTKEGVAEEDPIWKHGVFTKLLIQGLHGGAADILGRVTAGSLYSFVDGALGPWAQRPLFKTNVSEFCSLRDNEPRVAKSTLRRLPEWFPDETSVYPLTPQHEPTSGTVDDGLADVFRQLQACNRHGLVEPVGQEHMYYAAINGTGCRLTALGAYYRELASKEFF